MDPAAKEAMKVGKAFDFPYTAHALAVYFAHWEDGGRRVDMALGRVAAEHWVRLLEADGYSQEELASLTADMDRGESESGSGWFELRLAFGTWIEGQPTSIDPSALT